MKLSKFSKNAQYLIVLLLGAVVFLIYGNNVKDICSVWQIGDEVGYLMNAAFLTSHDWNSIYEVIPYYGYGYSVILIPFFLLFHTGVEIIRCAVFVNILCIIFTYFIQIAVMKMMTKDNRLHVLALISFIMCFYPYVAGMAFQVISESLLVMLFWLSIFLFCKALQTKKIYYYIFYSFCISYMFFVHARAIVILAAALITMLVFVFWKKIHLNYAIVFGCSFIFFFVIGYLIKNYIINSIYTGITTEGELQNRNIITATYIGDRLKWLFNIKNVELYIHGFFAKLFYVLTSTLGMIAIGVCYIYKELIKREKKLSDAQLGGMIFLMLSFLMMFLVCCINGTGTSDNFTYFFYGRYFEYAMFPIVFIGIYECINSDLNTKEISILILLCLISGIISSHIINYLNSNEIHIDVYRIAGFAGAIMQNDNFTDLMFYLTTITILNIVAIYLFNKIHKGKIILLMLVMFYFYSSSSTCIDTIKQTNQRSFPDTEIAEYIIKHYNGDTVYFINDEYKYYGFYSRMQVLMPEIAMEVIQASQIDQLEQNSYFITYKGYPIDTTLKETEQSIMEGSVFNLYKK